MFWRRLDDEGHVTWALRLEAESVSADRLAHARAYGTICALYCVWTGTVPYPISPWLLYLILVDFPTIIDTQFIKLVNPNIATYLRGWPVNYTRLNLDSNSEETRLICTHLSPTVVCPQNPCKNMNHQLIITF